MVAELAIALSLAVGHQPVCVPLRVDGRPMVVCVPRRRHRVPSRMRSLVERPVAHIA
jgi:hypothetical protein